MVGEGGSNEYSIKKTAYPSLFECDIPYYLQHRLVRSRRNEEADI